MSDARFYLVRLPAYTSGLLHNYDPECRKAFVPPESREFSLVTSIMGSKAFSLKFRLSLQDGRAMRMHFTRCPMAHAREKERMKRERVLDAIADETTFFLENVG